MSLRNSKDSFPNQSRTIPTPQLISENGSFQSISVTYEDSEGIAEKRKLLSQLETRKRIKDDSWEPEPVAALQWSSLANQATPVDDKESKVGKTTKKVFLATGVNINQRSYLAKTIQKLGGTFLQSDTWRPECTHLIVGRLSRTEKCLAACAAGAW